MKKNKKEIKEEKDMAIYEVCTHYEKDENGDYVRKIKPGAKVFEEFVLTTVDHLDASKEELLECALATIRGLAKQDELCIEHRFSKEEPGACMIFGMDPDNSVSVGWRIEIKQLGDVK
jgi:hypothetical protein